MQSLSFFLLEWHHTNPDNQETDDAESAISKHQAHLLVPPDNSKKLCTLCIVTQLLFFFTIFPFTYDSIKNVLIAQELFYTVFDKSLLS